MKILITTGIYPPKIGGPAQYAKNLKDGFEKNANKVLIQTYGLESYLPTGIRHLLFFVRSLFTVPFVDAVIILDTFSTALPAVLACKIFGQRSIIRTGGDFLWEQYVERTKKKILFRNFYETETLNFSFKEKLIFKLTKWTLQNSNTVVFSTEWQQKIFINHYNLNEKNTTLIENYCGPKVGDADFESKIFISSTRKLVWKNLDTLRKAFEAAQKQHPEINLFEDNLPYPEFMDKLSKSYAVILTSLGDISPNMIFDAIRYNRPFICTKEVGIYDRIKNAGIFVDPLNEGEIQEAISEISTIEGYKKAKEKVLNFNFVHTWQEIVASFLKLIPLTKSESLWNRAIFVRYFVCGVIAAALNVFTLYLFTDIFGVWYLYSSIVAFFVSVLVSFSLQKFVVFRDWNTSSLHHQFSRFFAAVVLGVLTNTIIMYICVDVFGIWYILSQLIAGFFVMIQNFLFYKFFIFNK